MNTKKKKADELGEAAKYLRKCADILDAVSADINEGETAKAPKARRICD